MSLEPKSDSGDAHSESMITEETFPSADSKTESYALSAFGSHKVEEWQFNNFAEPDKVDQPASAATANEKTTTQISAHLDDDDVENPRNWSPARRWAIVLVSSLMVAVKFVTYKPQIRSSDQMLTESTGVLGPSMIVPAAPQVLMTFHVTNTTYRTLLVTIWELGEGLSSFVAGPLSEIYGRTPVYHIGNLLGLVSIVASALSVDIDMLIAFRCFSGFFLLSPVIQPAIIGDVTRPETRGAAMAISGMIRILAPFVAPISGAYINQALGWRWVIWILAILVGALSLLCLLVIRETYAVKILQKKSERLNTTPASTPDPGSRPVVTVKVIIDGFARPLRLLMSSYTLILVCIYNGVSGGILLLMITTLTESMENGYGFNRGSVGLTYVAPSLGLTLGVLFYGLTSDKYVKHRGQQKAEHRLIHTAIASWTLPLGLVLYGWTLHFRVQFTAPLVGSGIIAFSFLLTTLPISNYLIDAFGVHSASALAAYSIVQSVFATTLPLAGPALNENLGYGWANTLLAFLSAAFIPPLLLLMRSTHSDS